MEEDFGMLDQKGVGNIEGNESISDFKEVPEQEYSSISSNEYGASNEERFTK